LILALWSVALCAQADPEADLAAFRRDYQQRFPKVELDQFVLGVYAIDEKLREQYEAINEFPPYEFALDEGAELARERFRNGSELPACLAENGSKGVNEYPYFDRDAGEIVTLPVAINRCRMRNGEEPLSYRRQPLSKILAYLNFSARGSRRAVALPDDRPARIAYESGREYFYMKRGQLNLSCADCHVTAAGRHLREQTLAPLLGAVNHYPVYGLSWGALGTLHQRFVGCLEQVRAEPEYPQSQAFRELEYFLAIMSNGLPMSGPGIHR
jgi:sulfur-oxidizing protein SoxA